MSGVFVEPGPDRDALNLALAKHNCYPVYIDEKMLDLYYNGYCNNVLWPLFHYVPLPLEARLSETKNLQNQWKAYVHTNELFARAIMQLYQENDVLWLHDYHVMLLPKMLKEIKPSVSVPDQQEYLITTLPFQTSSEQNPAHVILLAVLLKEMMPSVSVPLPHPHRCKATVMPRSWSIIRALRCEKLFS
jgi:hypothetical protein